MSAPEASPAHAEDLDAVRARAFDLLAEGADRAGDPAHTPSVATIGEDGAPRLRTVVLRAFEWVPPARPSLRFHTDSRAAKVAEIAADPRVTLHVYDAGQKIQLRLTGLAWCHAGDHVARAAWLASHGFSRLCYMGSVPPGAVSDHPTGGWRDELESLDPKAHDLWRGFDAFTAVTVEILSLEWLYLAASGHRRALLTFEPGKVEGHWLVP